MNLQSLSQDTLPPASPHLPKPSPSRATHWRPSFQMPETYGRHLVHMTILHFLDRTDYPYHRGQQFSSLCFSMWIMFHVSKHIETSLPFFSLADGVVLCRLTDHTLHFVNIHSDNRRTKLKTESPPLLSQGLTGMVKHKFLKSNLTR